MPLNGFALPPIRRRIGDEPVAGAGIVDIERARLRRQPGLRPIDPQAEAQTRLVREVGDARRARAEISPDPRASHPPRETSPHPARTSRARVRANPGSCVAPALRPPQMPLPQLLLVNNG